MPGHWIDRDRARYRLADGDSRHDPNVATERRPHVDPRPLRTACRSRVAADVSSGPARRSSTLSGPIMRTSMTWLPWLAGVAVGVVSQSRPRTSARRCHLYQSAIASSTTPNAARNTSTPTIPINQPTMLLQQNPDVRTSPSIITAMRPPSPMTCERCRHGTPGGIAGSASLDPILIVGLSTSR